MVICVVPICLTGLFLANYCYVYLSRVGRATTIDRNLRIIKEKYLRTYLKTDELMVLPFINDSITERYIYAAITPALIRASQSRYLGLELNEFTVVFGSISYMYSPLTGKREEVRRYCKIFNAPDQLNPGMFLKINCSVKQVPSTFSDEAAAEN